MIQNFFYQLRFAVMVQYLMEQQDLAAVMGITSHSQLQMMYAVVDASIQHKTIMYAAINNMF